MDSSKTNGQSSTSHSQQSGGSKPPNENELVSNTNQGKNTTSITDEEHLTDSLNTVIIADEDKEQHENNVKHGDGSITRETNPESDVDKEEPATVKAFSTDTEPNLAEENVFTPPNKKGENAEQDKDAAKEILKASTVKDENGFVYYKCRFCGLTYNFMDTLKAHERVHDVMRPYLCNKCGEAFHYKCELEYHAQSHFKQKGYKCDCGRTFFQYTELLYHKHPGEDNDEVVLPLPANPAPPVIPSPSMPAINPAAFPTPDFAEKGYEPRHPMRLYSETRTKPYICQYCSKSYSDSRQLAYHMYSHRGERMFNPRSSRYLMCRNENSYMSPGADV
jgi:hypothetical protein